MTKIIGLTGGIGSGKTTVARLFQAEGIPVYIADEEAKKIMDLPDTVQKVSQIFGNSIVFDGKIDKKKLSEIVFKDPNQLKLLNGVIHPLVKKHFEDWLHKHSSFPFVVKEAAILFESGSYKYCDIIISVVAAEEIRIQRVINRDNTTKEAVLDRMKNQWTDQQRVEKSDFIIKNENLIETEEQFRNILKKLNNFQ